MIADTYFNMLENPSLRSFDLLLNQEREYLTKVFDKDVYENSRRMTFNTLHSAYSDWISEGRQKGLEYAPGKTTLLKIILKCKDETELIDAWLQHHEQLVGSENIIIMDCGSETPEYLTKLSRISQRILVIGYPHHYDRLHSIDFNRHLFSFLAKECRFLTILDADEFLCGCLDDQLSANNALTILKNSPYGYHCGTWLFNSKPPHIRDQKLDMQTDIYVDISTSSLSKGMRGKSIARTDIIEKLTHLGHNMPNSRSSQNLILSDSFGKIFIVHLSRLPYSIQRKRLLAHVIAKGGLSQTDLEAIHNSNATDVLTRITNDKSAHGGVRLYAQQLLDLEISTVSMVNASSADGDDTLESLRINLMRPSSAGTLCRQMATLDFRYYTNLSAC